MLPNNDLENSQEYTESSEYFEKYPPMEKQYPNAAKYSEYESLQTGAMGKVIN